MELTIGGGELLPQAPTSTPRETTMQTIAAKLAAIIKRRRRRNSVPNMSAAKLIPRPADASRDTPREAGFADGASAVEP